MTKDDEILALKSQLLKAQKATQGVLKGMESAQLTPLKYRFALIRGRYLKSREHPDYKCLKLAGSDANNATLRKMASEYMADPVVMQVIDTERAKQSEVLRLDADYVLSRAMELGDKCLGKIPVVTSHVDDEGDTVYQSSLIFNASGAGKSAELLGKHLGMWVDKTELTGKDGADLSTAREVVYVGVDKQ